MTDERDPRQAGTAEQQADSSARREPVAGTTDEQQNLPDDAAVEPSRPLMGTGDDELEAQAADDFFHDRPAATSARVFDPEGSPEA